MQLCSCHQTTCHRPFKRLLYILRCHFTAALLYIHLQMRPNPIKIKHPIIIFLNTSITEKRMCTISTVIAHSFRQHFTATKLSTAAVPREILRRIFSLLKTKDCAVIIVASIQRHCPISMGFLQRTGLTRSQYFTLISQI